MTGGPKRPLVCPENLQSVRDQVYSTIQLPLGGVKVEFDDAEDWENAPESKGDDDQDVAVELPFPGTSYQDGADDLALPGAGIPRARGMTGSLFLRPKISMTPSGTLTLGEWSKKIVTTVRTKEGEAKETGFHVKLLELSDDLGDFLCLDDRSWRTSGVE